MRIGIDATCWANDRGYGRFTREICTAMVAQAPQDQFVFFADDRAAERIQLSGQNVYIEQVSQSVSPTEAASAEGNRSPLDMLRLTRAVSKQKVDVFFSPSVYTFFPLPPGLPALVTLHDAIAERFPELTLPTKKARLYWKAKVKLALMQSKLVLTVSEFSARDLERVLGVDRKRIRVATEAPAPIYRPSDSAAEIAHVAEKIGLPPGARWFVYVGGFNPHKHVDLLVQAHAEVSRDAHPPLFLLLVGTLELDVFHGDQGRIRDTIAQCSAQDRVLWTGYVKDEDLRHLHSGAVALVLPSECEGFGLPAVEAAACGTPVIATAESPLPELLPGGGLFIEPGDVAALTSAMRVLAGDEARRRQLGAKALERASRLSWPRAAQVALSALRECAG